MNKWPILEEKINKILISLFLAIKSLILKVVPVKVQGFLSSSVLKFKTKQQGIFQTTKNKTSKILSWFMAKIKFIKIETRERLRFIIIKFGDLQKIRIKDIDVKKSLSQFTQDIKERFKEYKLKLKYQIEYIGVKNIITGAILSVLFLGIIGQIYIESRKMLIDTGVMRDPASLAISRNYESPRPIYYKKDEKHLLIRNVRFPVYVGSKSRSLSVTMELTITSSNKYIRAYLDENRYLVDDIFNTKVEPIIPAFPLEEEGKIILKNKIKKELNLLLKNLKVEGQVEEIHIHAITAG